MYAVSYLQAAVGTDRHDSDILCVYERLIGVVLDEARRNVAAVGTAQSQVRQSTHTVIVVVAGCIG